MEAGKDGDKAARKIAKCIWKMVRLTSQVKLLQGCVEHPGLVRVLAGLQGSSEGLRALSSNTVRCDPRGRQRRRSEKLDMLQPSARWVAAHAFLGPG